MHKVRQFLIAPFHLIFIFLFCAIYFLTSKENKEKFNDIYMNSDIKKEVEKRKARK
jgi:cbb3-type cytochrome oxidase subunit 3